MSHDDLRTGFATLASDGLDWDSVPLALLAKGHRLHWDPTDIDFTDDVRDWGRLPASYRKALTYQVAMFVAGEEAVCGDILSFIKAMEAEGRVGDTLYLSQFCYEEARHTEVFRRWMDAVGLTEDLHGYVRDNPGYRDIFCRRLPAALRLLESDPSPARQVAASVVYNHIVEGTLALTGYFAFNVFCESLGVLPAMREIIRRIGLDERRHMAWGTYTCRRHVAADPENWHVVRREFDELLPLATGSLEWVFDHMHDSPFRFGRVVTVRYALGRARRRLRAISAARGGRTVEVERDPAVAELEDRFAAEDRTSAAGVQELLTRATAGSGPADREA
ncbi:R2-like ligand-binding oxidase [Streptomyces sp. NPDC059629]|uniref:R2-like ligand-binding oxidase n=1 Tax=Streptomyces sp. NPDC059629 TaxID=3346889 RepID=UPI00367D434A